MLSVQCGMSGRATPWEIRSIELFSLPFTLSSPSLFLYLFPPPPSLCSHSNSPLTIIHASEGAACVHRPLTRRKRREVF